MKRTYVNRLPKNEEVKNTNVRIENGQLFVEVEFEDKFEPKDGDFCISDAGFIFVLHNTYNVGKQMRAFSYIGESDNNKEIFKNLTYTINNGRFATPEEKSDFLERLEKECGKKWNAEKKCLEDIYIPKFGDIVRIDHPEVDRFKRNYVISIFPNKKVPQESVNGFFDIATIDMDGYVKIDDSYAAYNHNHVYIASPSEKKELFDKLAEAGKKWNAEKKCLEDIRWRAKKNEIFYYLDNEGNNVLTGVEDGGIFASMRYESNNYFRTEEAAQEVADQLKEIFKNSKAE